MHDPQTVAFEIRYPWKAYSSAKARNEFERHYRKSFITIWHVDPEKDGSDDSCDWWNRKGQLNEKEKALREAIWDGETLFDNRPHYPDSKEHLIWSPVRASAYALLRKQSRTHFWQLAPRWHVWHWKLQIHPLQAFKRWAFSRCCKCGGRFPWGYAPCSNSWSGSGPTWFGEKNVYHSDCQNPKSDGAAQVAKG